MRLNNIYGNRLFEEEGKGGGSDQKQDNPELQAKLDRLAHLEKENKELIASRDKAKEAKRKEEEDKLKQQGELQKLLDAKEKELESIKVKADAFEQLRQAEIEEAKKTLGDKWVDEYENLSLPTLRKTVQLLFDKKKVEGTDKGEGLNDPPKIQLTEAQKKEAHQKFEYKTPEEAEKAWYEVLKKTGKIK